MHLLSTNILSVNTHDYHCPINPRPPSLWPQINLIYCVSYWISTTTTRAVKKQFIKLYPTGFSPTTQQSTSHSGCLIPLPCIYIVKMPRN